MTSPFTGLLQKMLTAYAPSATATKSTTAKTTATAVSIMLPSPSPSGSPESEAVPSKANTTGSRCSFTCEKCGAAFSSAAVLKLHRESHRVSSVANANATTENRLRNKRKFEREYQRFCCPDCFTDFYSQLSLDKHCAFLHPPPDTAPASPPSDTEPSVPVPSSNPLPAPEVLIINFVSSISAELACNTAVDNSVVKPKSNSSNTINESTENIACPECPCKFNTIGGLKIHSIRQHKAGKNKRKSASVSQTPPSESQNTRAPLPLLPLSCNTGQKKQLSSLLSIIIPPQELSSSSISQTNNILNFDDCSEFEYPATPIFLSDYEDDLNMFTPPKEIKN